MTRREGVGENEKNNIKMVVVVQEERKRKIGISKEEKLEALGDHQRVDRTFVAWSHNIQSQFPAFHRILSRFVGFYRNFSSTKIERLSLLSLSFSSSTIRTTLNPIMSSTNSSNATKIQIQTLNEGEQDVILNLKRPFKDKGMASIRQRVINLLKFNPTAITTQEEKDQQL